MSAFTTFPHEITHLSLEHRFREEHLVSAHVRGLRAFVATDGVVTDYPMLDNGRVFWDSPEVWTEEFKSACAEFVLTSNLALIEREYRSVQP